jgi:hypothetical protein
VRWMQANAVADYPSIELRTTSASSSLKSTSTSISTIFDQNIYLP